MASGIIRIIPAPTTVALNGTAIYMKGMRASGTGFTIEIPIPKQPTSVTGTDVAYYNNDTWNSTTVGDWFWNGCILTVAFVNPPSALGVYGMRGTINIAY